MYSFIWQSRTVSKPRQRHCLSCVCFGVCTVLCILKVPVRFRRDTFLPTCTYPFNLLKIQTEFPLSHINWLIVLCVYGIYWWTKHRMAMKISTQRVHTRNQNRVPWKRPKTSKFCPWVCILCCIWWMVNMWHTLPHRLPDTAITRWDCRARGYVFCCLFAFNLTFI